MASYRMAIQLNYHRKKREKIHNQRNEGFLIIAQNVTIREFEKQKLTQGVK